MFLQSKNTTTNSDGAKIQSIIKDKIVVHLQRASTSWLHFAENTVSTYTLERDFCFNGNLEIVFQNYFISGHG